MKLILAAAFVALNSTGALAAATSASLNEAADPPVHQRRVFQAGKVGTFLQAEVEYDPSDSKGRRLRNLNGRPSTTTFNVQLDSGIYEVHGPPGWAKKLESGVSEITIPPGSEIDEQTATIDTRGGKPDHAGNPKEDTSRRDLQESRTPEQQRNLAVLHRQLAVVEGTKTVLAVKVIHTGLGKVGTGTTTDTMEVIADDIFGTSIGGADLVNLHSQYLACSHGKLNIQPVGNRASINGAVTNIVNGIVEVTVNTNCSTLPCDGAMRNEVNAALVAAFGSAVQGGATANHVMHCLPPYAMNGIAYAYINSWNSVYSDKWCQYVSTQVHEVGHNLNLAHSNEGTTAYADQTGFMGYSYSQDDQRMCFNNAKNYQLGWFSSATVEVPLYGSFSGNIKGQVNYNPFGGTQTPVVVKVGDYYIGFNHKVKHNLNSAEGGNQVTIQRRNAGIGYSESWLEAKLSAGGTFSKQVGSAQLTVNVVSITTGADLGVANVDISYGCSSDAQCQDANTCNGAEVCSAGSCQPGTPDVDQLNCCGNNICDAGEETSCPLDCIPQITCGAPISGTTVGEPPVQLATCVTTDGTGGAVLYELVGAEGSVTLSTCTGTSFDSKIRVYREDGTCVTGNDDTCNLQSTVTFTAVQGTKYKVYVHGYGAAEGAYTLSSTCTQGPTGPEPTPKPTTANPTNIPTNIPTNVPTNNPTTANPTSANPTNVPTNIPTNVPTTANPTNVPTNNPTNVPTNNPTNVPTNNPTNVPTNNPTNVPSTANPTSVPTNNPTNIPTNNPTNVPTNNPVPTNDPTTMPTVCCTCITGVKNSSSCPLPCLYVSDKGNKSCVNP